MKNYDIHKADDILNTSGIIFGEQKLRELCDPSGKALLEYMEIISELSA